MDDLSSARLEVQALLSTLCPEDDPAEVFFKLLPTPEEMRGVTDLETSEHLNERIAVVLESFGLFDQNRARETNDFDFAYIFNYIAEVAMHEPTKIMACLKNALAFTALKNSRNGEVSGQGTKKHQLLAYYLWHLHGSKDEAPLLQDSASTRPRASADLAPHDFLPSSRVTRGPCSNCGNPQATSRCSGCHIVKSGKVVFAAFYCDRSCMKAQWKAHKPACKETRSLRRAATVFTELWFENLQLTLGGSIASVTEEDGLIETKIDALDRRAHLRRPLQPFPRHLFESEEQVLACVSAGTCENVIQEGKLLFWSLMRPVHAFVEAVRVQPKNGHKTVCFSYPDDQFEFPFMSLHLVFRLTLPSGLRFAFDPTGSQNGWQDTLAPWDAYEQHRIRFIKDIETIDGYTVADRINETKQSQLVMCALLGVAKGCLGLTLFDGGLEELLHRLDDAGFEATRVSLVKAFREKLRGYRTKTDKGPTEKS